MCQSSRTGILVLRVSQNPEHCVAHAISPYIFMAGKTKCGGNEVSSTVFQREISGSIPLNISHIDFNKNQTLAL